VSPPRERVAAIDVGSNTILLTIAELDPTKGLTIIEEAEDQPRLGAGVSATGGLSDEAMKQAFQSLRRMHAICMNYGVERVGAVATAAVRNAGNGEEFAQRVRDLGIPLRIISPEHEAVLAYRSAAYHFPTVSRMLVADIGGGSLELVGAVKGQVELTLSLPVGAVRLTELELPLPKLRKQIQAQLSRAISRDQWVAATIIGSGGTFTTLARMILARRDVSGGQVHGVNISMAELEPLLTELADMSPEQRRGVPGLKRERSDIIVAGVAVIAQLLRTVGSEAVTVSGFGLREGVLLEMLDVSRRKER